MRDVSVLIFLHTNESFEIDATASGLKAFAMAEPGRRPDAE